MGCILWVQTFLVNFCPCRSSAVYNIMFIRPRYNGTWLYLNLISLHSWTCRYQLVPHFKSSIITSWIWWMGWYRAQRNVSSIPSVARQQSLTTSITTMAYDTSRGLAMGRQTQKLNACHAEFIIRKCKIIYTFPLISRQLTILLFTGIGKDNGLALNRWKSITPTNNDPELRLHMPSPGSHGLKTKISLANLINQTSLYRNFQGECFCAFSTVHANDVDICGPFYWHGFTWIPAWIRFSAGIFYRGVPSFATDCPCSVWCRGVTTCPLYVGPLFGNLVWNDSGFVSLT